MTFQFINVVNLLQLSIFADHELKFPLYTTNVKSTKTKKETKKPRGIF